MRGGWRSSGAEPLTHQVMQIGQILCKKIYIIFPVFFLSVFESQKKVSIQKSNFFLSFFVPPFLLTTSLVRKPDLQKQQQMNGRQNRESLSTGCWMASRTAAQ